MKGELVYLYAFDVANEIAIEKIREILKGQPVPFEISIDHTFPKDIPLYKPLSIELPILESLLSGKEVKPIIHIYEVGVVSINLRVAFETSDLQELLPFHRPILENGKNLDEIAYNLCKETCKSIKEAIIQGALKIPEPEAYTVFCLIELGAQKNTGDWFIENRRNIAALLTENKLGVLSDQQTDDVMRIQLSYSNNDIAIIDWDAALVVDLTGYLDDTIYVLELANLQLEEYKIMDQRLDRYLNKAYEDIRKQKFGLLGPHSKVLRSLRTLRVDVTKLNDEVTHITKFFGDWYLARVYLGARERFHIDKWRNSVAERLTQLDALYSVVHTEVSNLRMLWLEVIIVVFFAIDLLTIFFSGK